MQKTFNQIQEEAIKKYNIVIVINSNCRRRTHAHTDGSRQICKWEAKNSLKATFTLFHEIGHIETFKSNMRRCESEFYATQWALNRLYEQGVNVKEDIIKTYQAYIDRELERGLRRGGGNYNDNLKLVIYSNNPLFKEEPEKKREIKTPKERTKRAILWKVK